jgi:hypothetical protein
MYVHVRSLAAALTVYSLATARPSSTINQCSSKASIIVVSFLLCTAATPAPRTGAEKPHARCTPKCQDGNNKDEDQIEHAHQLAISESVQKMQIVFGRLGLLVPSTQSDQAAVPQCHTLFGVSEAVTLPFLRKLHAGPN